jgi:hypothetical protein
VGVGLLGVPEALVKSDPGVDGEVALPLHSLPRAFEPPRLLSRAGRLVVLAGQVGTQLPCWSFRPRLRSRPYRLRMCQTCSDGKRFAQSAVTVPLVPAADSGALTSM